MPVPADQPLLLVACADDATLALVGGALRRYPLSVSATADGGDAWYRFQERTPAALLVIEPLAGISAVQLCQLARAAAPGCPIALACAAAPDCGATALLAVPLQIPELRAFLGAQGLLPAVTEDLPRPGSQTADLPPLVPPPDAPLVPPPLPHAGPAGGFTALTPVALSVLAAVEVDTESLIAAELDRAPLFGTNAELDEALWADLLVAVDSLTGQAPADQAPAPERAAAPAPLVRPPAPAAAAATHVTDRHPEATSPAVEALAEGPSADQTGGAPEAHAATSEPADRGDPLASLDPLARAFCELLEREVQRAEAAGPDPLVLLQLDAAAEPAAIHAAYHELATRYHPDQVPLHIPPEYAEYAVYLHQLFGWAHDQAFAAQRRLRLASGEQAPAEPPPASTPTASDATLSASDELRAQLAHDWEEAQQAGGDALRLLGVRPETEPREIRAAFHRLSIRYHPDRLPRDLPAAERALAEQLFGRYSKAYERVYKEQRRQRFAQRQAEAAPPAERPATPAGASARALGLSGQGGIFFAHALRALKGRQYATARRYLAEACELEARQPRFLAHLGWAILLDPGEDNNQALHKARSCFQKALRVEPEQFQALVGMGALLTLVGQRPLARSYLDRGLALRPDCAAARELLGQVSVPAAGPALKDRFDLRPSGVIDDLEAGADARAPAGAAAA